MKTPNKDQLLDAAHCLFNSACGNAHGQIVANWLIELSVIDDDANQLKAKVESIQVKFKATEWQIMNELYRNRRYSKIPESQISRRLFGKLQFMFSAIKILQDLQKRGLINFVLESKTDVFKPAKLYQITELGIAAWENQI